MQNRIGQTIVLQYRYRLKQAQVIDLTINISMKAAKLSLERKIPMADGIVLATGRLHQAIVWPKILTLRDSKTSNSFEKRFVGSKASWETIPKGVPQYEEGPPVAKPGSV